MSNLFCIKIFLEILLKVTKKFTGCNNSNISIRARVAVLLSTDVSKSAFQPSTARALKFAQERKGGGGGQSNPSFKIANLDLR